MGLGEPLLHPRFLDIVRLAKERGLRVEVTTNALLLDEELAHGLLEAGLDQLVVSIDGASAEAFGRVRSGASLERIVEHVRYLHDHRGPYYGPRTRIGVEFVAMRSNVDELPGLGRLATRLGASFVIVSNVLAYTPELVGETLYEREATSFAHPGTSLAPRWELPKLDWDETVGTALGKALRGAGSISFLGQEMDAANNHCPFVSADACAIGWQGNVSPCPPLLHTYTCLVQGREKLITGWEIGRLPRASLTDLWRDDAYVAFRDRVRRFDFPPCTDCACTLAEGNEEDCFGNPPPGMRRLPLGARRDPLRLGPAPRACSSRWRPGDDSELHRGDGGEHDRQSSRGSPRRLFGLLRHDGVPRLPSSDTGLHVASSVTPGTHGPSCAGAA